MQADFVFQGWEESVGKSLFGAVHKPNELFGQPNSEPEGNLCIFFFEIWYFSLDNLLHILVKGWKCP